MLEEEGEPLPDGKDDGDAFFALLEEYECQTEACGDGEEA